VVLGASLHPDPPPPPVDVIGPKTESIPLAPGLLVKVAGLIAPPTPPAPTVTV
jgi:hypothetical protein